jgi:ankyrin repeat protein
MADRTQLFLRHDEKALSPQASLLLDTAGRGDLGRVKQLVAAGVDVNVCSSNGRTPLIYAALRAQPDVVEVLLQAEADVDAQADDGSTALIKARSLNCSGPPVPEPSVIFIGHFSFVIFCHMTND